MWVVACHLLIIWLAGLFLAFRALTLPSDKVPLAMKHADKAKRKSALGRLRFTTTALLVLLAACWALGAAAAFFGNRTLVICEAVSTVLLAAALGAMCADTFIAGARPWRQRVMPQKGAAAAPRPGGRPPANLTLTTVHPAGSTSNNMFVKRTFHFGADPAEADKKIILSMPTPE
ncbi:uncharacterized protein LOC122366539 [Amphibalanus amphitrite]|nr:uncharacterized protein LOC122366539 [Amphibalanus amphitrite]